MIFVGIIAGIFILGLAFETLYVKNSKYQLNNQSNLNFTVVQLSDLHGRTRFINGPISKLVNKINPDYVMITGDLVSKKKQLTHVLTELQKIKCRNIYFVPGNYEREGISKFSKRLYTQEEYETIILALQTQGITALENSGATIDIDSQKLFIYGFDNSIYGNEQSVLAKRIGRLLITPFYWYILQVSSNSSRIISFPMTCFSPDIPTAVKSEY